MSTTQQEAAEASINPSGTLKTSVSIYFTILGAGILLFECVRHRFRRVYDSRGIEGNSYWISSTSPSPKNYFGWIIEGFQTSDDEILERCGLDTLTFLRFLRMGQKITLLAIGLSAVLFPLYATADTPPTMRSHIDPLELISMSNLPEQDMRLWGSTIAAYIMCFYAMYLILKEYEYYVRRRHEILGQADAPQYSVLINDLPLKLRTRTTLERYVTKIFPIGLRCVYVAVECSKLEEMVAKREQVRNKLEHLLAQSEISGERPRLRIGKSCRGMLLCQRGSYGQVMDAINYYQDQLDLLNEQVIHEIDSIEDAQTQLANQMEAEEAGDVIAYIPIPDQKESNSEEMRQFGLNEDVNDRPKGSDVGNNDASRDAMKKSSMNVMRSAAFVSFTSLRSAQFAQQALQSSDPVCMAISPAPHVDDINWRNIGLSYRARAMGRLVSSLITGLIVLFWTIPTAFVASLSTVESLRHALPFLDKAFDKYPLLEDLFKQIAPLSLVLLSAIAPMVFRFMSEREGHPSNTEVRASLFSKLAYFQLIQIFFVTVIVGTILDSLKVIIDQPKTLIAMLGRSMPQQSTFFMSYVIVLTGLSLVLELLRVIPIVLSALFTLFAPKLTRRERNGRWLGLSYVSQSDPFDPTSTFADCFLVMLLTFTFTSIAPLVCYFTGWFFFVAEVVYRRQVLYVYRSTYFAFGAFWPRLHNFLIIALVVSQLTLLGLLSLKKAVVQFILIMILIFLILLFHFYVAELFPRVAKYLPLTECVRLDTIRGQRDPNTMFSFLDNVYRQPAMTQKQTIRADYRMIGEDYETDTYLSSPEFHTAEDQKLFTAHR